MVPAACDFDEEDRIQQMSADDSDQDNSKS